MATRALGLVLRMTGNDLTRHDQSLEFRGLRAECRHHQQDAPQ